MKNCNCVNCPEPSLQDDVLCTGAPINAHCVKSTQNLECIESSVNDRLDVILAKIDDKLCQVITDDDEHTRDVICLMLQDTPSIDLTCDDGNDTLQADLIVSTGDDSLDRIMFWSGTDVRTRTLAEVVPDIQDLIGDIYQDTNTIDFTYDTVGRRVSADVRISNSIPGNAIQAFADGLWSPLFVQNQLVYGGQVTWTGVGYEYDVAASGYYINFVFYESPATTISLDPADVTDARIDTFIVDTSATTSVLTGTPSVNPAEPPLDIATQLRLSAVLVPANSTEPLQDQCIYAEDAEWTPSGSGTFNTTSGTAPCFGVFSIEVTSPATGDSLLLTEPTASTITPAVYGTLTLVLKSTGTLSGGTISLQWENFSALVGDPVVIGHGSYGFNENDTSSCQAINIPINYFGLTGSDLVDSFRITATEGTASFSLFIDNICLSTAQIGTSSLNLYTFQNGLRQTPGTNIVEFGTNPLLHNTTLDTANFVQTFRGATIYNYPYQFVGLQSFENSTGITSWLKPVGSQDVLAADNINTVRLGINYSSNIYNAISDLNGYFGPDDIGYSLAVNWTGHGSFGSYTDNPQSKTGGLLFHTLDSGNTEMVSIYGKHPTTNNSDVGISAGGTGWLNYKIASFHDDKEITFWGYPDTRDDGIATKFLTTNSTGGLELRTATSSSSAIASYLVDGGGVAWLQNYDYNVSAANYVILGSPHSSPETPITLAVADGTFDRIDLIVVDDAGTVQVITGDASVNPQNPSYDPATQLPLTFIVVGAGSSAPSCNVLTSVYLENTGTPTEWAAVSNAGAWVVNSAVNPHAGTVDMNATSIAIGNKVTLTPASPFNADDITQIDLFIRSKATWGSTSSGRNLVVRFQAGASVDIGTGVIIPPRGAFGWDSTTTGVYQQIVLPRGLFNLPGGAQVTSMTIASVGGSGTQGFWMDDIRIEKNCNTNTGTAITADNGLIMSTPTNVQLGSNTAPGAPLLHDTYINNLGYITYITGTATGFNSVLDVRNTSSGIGINGVGQTGVVGSGQIGIKGGGTQLGVWGFTTAGIGSYGQAINGGTPAIFDYSHSAGLDDNNVKTVLRLDRNIYDGGAADGIGSSIDFYTKTDGISTAIVGNQLISKLTTALNATATSQLDITGVNSTATGTIMSAHGSGVVGIGISSSYTSSRLNIVDDILSQTAVRISSTASGGQSLVTLSSAGTTSGLLSQVVQGVGITGQASSTGTGGNFSSVTGFGLQASSGTSPAAIENFNATTSSEKEVAILRASTTGTAANGLGGYIDFQIETDDGNALRRANQLIWKWTNATAATRTSQLSITTVNSAVTATEFTLDGDGTGTFLGTYSPSNTLRALNTTNTAVKGEATSGNGVYGTATTGIGGLFSSTSNIAVAASSSSGLAIQAITSTGSTAATFKNDPASTNSVVSVIQLYRTTSATAADGLGGSLDFLLEHDGGGTAVTSNQIISKWTTAASATRTSQAKLTGVLSASNVDLQTWNADGSWQIRPITATEASAITPAEGMMLFVSNTNGTFTSIGFWGYRNGAWAAF